jgi:hypothetical protein
VNRRTFLASGVPLIGVLSVGGRPNVLRVPISREKNSQFKVNRFEPEFLLKPRVLLSLRNPANRQGGKIRGFIDTGADGCHIGAGLAARIGLQPTGDPGAKVWGASGPFEVKPTIVDMELLGDDELPYAAFGRKPTQFYIQPSLQDVILGVRGFLDQFAEVRFDYRGAVVTLVA